MLSFEWVDEINTVGDTEKTMYICDHLGGEARQEVKYWPRAEREDSKRIREILREIYGQPYSVTRLQKQIFDRRQHEGESIHEYSHALMAVIDDINHCDIKQTWCSNWALRDQFAENMCV